jgi:DNA-binding MarR family transcriptional regulator
VAEKGLIMEQPDSLIHQPVRLKALVDATEGNLGAHIATLEQACYVAVEKDFAGNRPRTRIALTLQGLHAFENYVAYLRAIIGTAS